MRRPLLIGLFALMAACNGQDEHPEPAPAAPEMPSDPDAFDLADASAPGAACVGVDAPATRLPVDLLALVDGSGSMRDATVTGTSKWVATKAALRSFLEQAPSEMRFGLSLFPGSGDAEASCSESYYRDTALPIADVRDMAPSALDRLDAATPGGQTPTGPALAAALGTAQSYAVEHRERSVVVVLATDGLPTVCEPTDTQALAKLAEDAVESPGRVRTLVVASKSPQDAEAIEFDRIARAGGTTRALIIDPSVDFASQLQSALGSTATRKVACDLSLPEPPAGQRLDYDTLNVVISRGRSRVTVPRVFGPTQCESGGWYYSDESTLERHVRLSVCPAVCERVASDPSATLRLELGCKTVVK